MSDPGKQTHHNSNLLQRLISKSRGQVAAITPSRPSSFTEPEPLVDSEQTLTASPIDSSSETGPSETGHLPESFAGETISDLTPELSSNTGAIGDTQTAPEPIDSTPLLPVSPLPPPESTTGDAVSQSRDNVQTDPAPLAMEQPVTLKQATDKGSLDPGTTASADNPDSSPRQESDPARALSVPTEISHVPQQEHTEQARLQNPGERSPLFTQPVLTSAEQHPIAPDQPVGKAEETVEVTISIGRIEIRPPAQPAAEQSKRRRPDPPMPLKEYLKKRDQGAL